MSKLMKAVRVLVALGVGTFLSACERHELERKMEEFCMKDAGVKVYETVVLSNAEYSRLLEYSTAKRREDYYGPEYRFVTERKNLVGTDEGVTRGEARIFRSHSAIYRRSDNRLLGESVNYFRTGGDGLSAGHPSSGSCKPRVPDLGKSVLLKGE